MDNSPDNKNQSRGVARDEAEASPTNQSLNQGGQVEANKPLAPARDDSHESHTAPLPLVTKKEPSPNTVRGGSAEPPKNLPITPSELVDSRTNPASDGIKKPSLSQKEELSSSERDEVKTSLSEKEKILARVPESKTRGTGLEGEVHRILTKSNLVGGEKEGKRVLSKALKSSLRTYERDIASVIRDKKASVVSIRQAEVEKIKKEGGVSKATLIDRQKAPKKRFNWSKIFVGLLILLLVLAGGALLYSVLTREKPKDVQEFEKEVVSPGAFFFVDKQIEFPVGNLGSIPLRNKLLRIQGDTVGALGEIAHLYITEGVGDTRKLLSIGDFLKAIDIKIPGELLRNLDKSFMFGVHVFDGNEPFLVLKTSSYGNAFSGMLAWEETMRKDWEEIFISDDIDFLSGATSTQTILKLGPNFKDKVVLNRDSRVILDNEEEIVFVYSFVNADTIVITTNENTLKEIIDRLARIRFQR